jgi:hypothetical protein
VASTVTPGSTPPEASRTTPAIDCADATVGAIAKTTAAINIRIAAVAVLDTRMLTLLVSTGR